MRKTEGYKKKKSKNLFLLELVISIFFFATVAAVAVRLFAESYTLTKNSKNLSESVTLCSNAAEVYRNHDRAEFEKELPGGQWQGDTYQVKYDSDWKHNMEGAKYVLEIVLPTEDGKGTGETAEVAKTSDVNVSANTAVVKVTSVKDKEVIYELSVRKAERGQKR